MIKKANEITLKNFLNCYYRESDNYNLKKLSDNQYLFQVSLSDSDDTIEIKVKISTVLRTPI
jgi:siderophore synthetase component